MKQKLILDTNVLVSALISRGIPYLISTRLFVENKIELCISDQIFGEYNRVLESAKFKSQVNFDEKAKILLEKIGKYGITYFPQIKIDLIKDHSDNKFLELADESNADFLITGNTNDFTFSQYKNTKIVSPKEYWENYKPIES